MGRIFRDSKGIRMRPKEDGTLHAIEVPLNYRDVLFEKAGKCHEDSRDTYFIVRVYSVDRSGIGYPRYFECLWCGSRLNLSKSPEWVSC